eukprot:TRINITY_DN1899_c0_g1_i1.p1 TRINITY_DN1899_c0_g1~~TRINITY_DN1899_c0_g1_i1.p1  ORF type:complete len:298 (-),score=70.96 TRINITY_DN1899_c0_g1_i1:137-1030(-)
MKFGYLALLLVLSVATAAEQPNNANAMRSPWPAKSLNERFLSRIRRAAPPLPSGPVPAGYGSVVPDDLPAEFDGRTAFPGCIHGVLDQGDCGSCWAFAASETLSDRYCIYSSGRVNVVLSPQDLLSCESMNLGCTMGSLPEWAWAFLEKRGITTMDCVPYVDGNGGHTKCPVGCTGAGNYTLYRASNYTHVGDFVNASNHVAEIMRAVTQGPVDVTFNVYADFDSYTGGIYRHKIGGYEGLHSVKIIGYGADNGEAYWLVQNSWGTDWGIENGYFKIARGVDECSIERLAYTGYPAL